MGCGVWLGKDVGEAVLVVGGCGVSDVEKAILNLKKVFLEG